MEYEVPEELKNSKYNFFALDTSAIMNNPDGIKNLFEYANKTKKKVLVLSSVIDELDEISKRGDVIKSYLARKARNVLNEYKNSKSFVYVDMTDYVKIGTNKMDIVLNYGHIDKQYLVWSGKRIKENGHYSVDELLKYLGYMYPVLVITNDKRIIFDLHMKRKGNAKGDAYEFDGVKEIYKGYAKLSEDKLNEHFLSLSDEDKLKYFEDENGPLYPNQFVVFDDNELLVREKNKLRNLTLNELSSYYSPKIKMKNVEQRAASYLLMNPDIKLVFLYGPAGTGKTFLSLLSGLMQWKENKSSVGDLARYSDLVAFMGIYPVGKDIGFLPGSKEKKMKPWAEKLNDNLKSIKKETGKFFKDLKGKTQKIDVSPTTFLRGRNITDSFIIVEEAQNLPTIIIKTVLTRVGDGSKIVVIGDPDQIDNKYLSKSNNGLVVSINRLVGEKYDDFPEVMGVMNLIKNERSEVSKVAANRL